MTSRRVEEASSTDWSSPDWNVSESISSDQTKRKKSLSPTKLARLEAVKASIARKATPDIAKFPMNVVKNSMELHKTSVLPDTMKYSASTASLLRGSALVDATSASLFGSHSQKYYPVQTPFNESNESDYYTPSDRIGRNYTLSAKGLTLTSAGKVKQDPIVSPKKKIEMNAWTSPSKSSSKTKKKEDDMDRGKHPISPALARHRQHASEKHNMAPLSEDPFGLSSSASSEILPLSSNASKLSVFPEGSRTYGRHLRQHQDQYVSPTRKRQEGASKGDLWNPIAKHGNGSPSKSSPLKPLLKTVVPLDEAARYMSSMDAYLKAMVLISSTEKINPIPDAWIERITSRLADHMTTTDPVAAAKNESVVLDCMEEIYAAYYRSGSKSILDYYLLAPEYAASKGICSFNLLQNPQCMWRNDEYSVREWKVLRETGVSPDNVFTAAEYIEVFLKVSDAALIAIQNMWYLGSPPSEWGPQDPPLYCNLRFTDITASLFVKGLPLPMEEFDTQVKKRCSFVLQVLKKYWITACAHTVSDHLPEIDMVSDKNTNSAIGSGTAQDTSEVKSLLQFRIDKDHVEKSTSLSAASPHHTSELVQYNHYLYVLNAASVLMGQHVRGMAVHSIAEYVRFLEDFAESERAIFSISIKMMSGDSTGREKTGLHRYLGLDPSPDTVLSFVQGSIATITKSGREVRRIDNLVPKLPFHLANSAAIGPGLLYDDDECVVSALERVKDIVQDALVNALEELEMFEPYVDFLSGSEFADVEKLVNWFKESDCDMENLPELRNALDRLVSIEKDMDTDIEDHCALPLFLVSCVEAKENVRTIINSCSSRILNVIADTNRVHMQSVCTAYDAISKKLVEEPIDSGELKSMVHYAVQIKEELEELAESVAEEVCKRAWFLMEADFEINTDDMQRLLSTMKWPEDIRGFQIRSDEIQNIQKTNMILVIESRTNALLELFSSIGKKIDKLRETPSSVDVQGVNRRIEAITALLEEAEVEADEVLDQETLLNIKKSEHLSVIAEIRETLRPIALLWSTLNEFAEKQLVWKNSPLADVNAEDAEQQVDQYKRTSMKLFKEFERLGVEYSTSSSNAAALKASVEDVLKNQIPIMQLICTPSIRARHWEEIARVTGIEIIPVTKSEDPESSIAIPGKDEEEEEEESAEAADPVYTLSQMMDLKLHTFVDDIEESCVAASKEYSLEKALDKMEDEWDGVEMQTKEYRTSGTSILTATDEIQQLLDDHIVKTQAMRGSRYNKPYLSRIENWEKTLVGIQDILDNWLKVQATWLYLEPIFGSDDIMRQMPTEGTLFKRVDEKWRKNMKEIVAVPRALSVVTQEGLLSDLEESNQELDTIQKGLSDYLETKRLFFPRFFFLSNDELLEILAETKDPLRVQPHLKKAFDGIALLEFQDNLDITAMISSEGEKVDFPYENIQQEVINPANSGGNVEVWLQDVENAMRKSTAYHLDCSIKDYATKDRLDWVKEWAGQIVLAVNQTNWTHLIFHMTLWHQKNLKKMSTTKGNL